MKDFNLALALRSGEIDRMTHRDLDLREVDHIAGCANDSVMAEDDHFMALGCVRKTVPGRRLSLAIRHRSCWCRRSRARTRAAPLWRPAGRSFG